MLSVCILGIWLISTGLFAQDNDWGFVGTHIYNLNQSNVGIGTGGVGITSKLRVICPNTAQNIVAEFRNTATNAQNRIGIQGYSVPQANFGTGGAFYGGLYGIYSSSTISGAGTRYGGFFVAANGVTNYGVRTSVSGANPSYGIYNGVNISNNYAYGNYNAITVTNNYAYGTFNNATATNGNYAYGTYNSATAVNGNYAYGTYSSVRAKKFAFGNYNYAVGDTNVYGVVAQASGTSNVFGILATAPASATNYAGYFNGNLHVTGSFTVTSDERLKDNVAAIQGSLEKVMQLQPKEYFYNSGKYPGLNLPKEKQFGLIAQEVASVIPEIVKEESVPVKPGNPGPRGEHIYESEKYQGVNYIAMIPILVQAIQEQQKQIEMLKARLQD